MSRNILPVLLVISFITADFETSCGQQSIQQEATESAAQPQRVVTLPVTTTWKFGVRVTGTGNTNNAQVTFPLPTDWPEQNIRIVSVDVTENTSGGKVKKLGSDASQFFFKVPQLAAGEVAEATVTMEVEKLESNPPQDPATLVFAKRISGRKMRDYLSPSPFIESRDKRIQELAKNLPVDPGDNAWDQVETIYSWVRENIEYRFDTEIRSCLTALDAGHGDCEEMSSLFVALCRARGIPARAVWIPEHTYPEFYLEDADGQGHWFPCQAAGSYAFGHMPEAKPILQKGDKFKVTGYNKPLRYIQPTMKAYGAAPQWEWLMQQVENGAPTADQR